MSNISKKTISIGGRELRFAALSFRALDEAKAEIELLMTPNGTNFSRPESREAVIVVALKSFAGAGETVTRDELLDGLDAFNFGDIVAQIFDRNSFLAKPGDEAAVGEAQAAPSQI